MPSDHFRLHVLSPAQVEQIDAAGLRLLEEVGIRLDHPEAQELLHGHGARIEGDRAYLPATLVKDALADAPGQVTIWGRDGQQSITLGDGGLYVHNAGGIPNMIDLETGERRPATTEDVRDSARVLDALPNVHAVTFLVTPQDVSPEIMISAAMARTFEGTTKPIFGGGMEKARDVEHCVAIAAAVAGGREALRQRPLLNLSVSPISPLTFSYDVTDAILAIARAGIPFDALPAPIQGATGPLTLAGSLAQQHAEVLAALLLVHLTDPTVPLGYCSRISVLDLRTGLSAWGNPEIGLTAACAVQLGQLYGLHTDVYGLCTSSKTTDMQNAYERMANALVPALAGADCLSGVGSLENGLAASYEQMVIDNEILDMIYHIHRGFVVDEDTLAVDVIAEVVESDGGTFLDRMHTVRHMRAKEVWIPELSDRRSWQEWAADGRTVVDRARERAKELLAHHEVPPLPDTVQEEIADILTH